MGRSHVAVSSLTDRNQDDVCTCEQKWQKKRRRYLFFKVKDKTKEKTHTCLQHQQLKHKGRQEHKTQGTETVCSNTHPRPNKCHTPPILMSKMVIFFTYISQIFINHRTYPLETCKENLLKLLRNLTMLKSILSQGTY